MMPLSRFRTLAMRAVRKAEGLLHRTLTALGLQGRLPSGTARLGVLVAYYRASWVFEAHLRALHDLAAEPFNYYVMANCTTAEERRWLDGVLQEFPFARVFTPWPALLPLSHGESLQRLVDQTSDEIIVLCDVDAFPVRMGWDEFLVQELQSREVVSVVVDMPARKRPVFLHPSFMAFRRRWLAAGRMTLLAGQDADPGYQITESLLRSGRMTRAHVTPLVPTRREIALAPPGTNELLGHQDLIHGFGTTYSDLVFHFWFARRIDENSDIHEGNVTIRGDAVDRVVRAVLGRLAETCRAARLEVVQPMSSHRGRQCSGDACRADQP